MPDIQALDDVDQPQDAEPYLTLTDEEPDAASPRLPLGPPYRIEAARLEGFHNGPRVGIWYLPNGRLPRGSVFCIQPLAEERNRARRTLALQARRLAARGWVVLLMDIYGTGDSPGEPAQATLECWRQDLLRGSLLARQRGTGPHVIWGVRGGALLAVDIAVALDQLVDAYVMWQAPPSGAKVVNALIEAGMSSGGGALRPEVFAAIGEMRMHPPPTAEHGRLPAVLFLELVDHANTIGDVSRVTCELTEGWLEAGYLATPRAARAAPFWLAQRRPVPSAAFDATEEFLDSLR